MARAQDADVGLDPVSDPLAAEPSPDPDVRRKVLVFYVDKAPALSTGKPSFRPNPHPNPNNPAALDTFPDTPNACEWNFNLEAFDLDPVDPAVSNPVPGGPSAGKSATRFRLTLYGTNLAGRDTSWTYIHTSGIPLIMEGNPVAFNFRPGGAAGNPFATGEMYASIEVCDCYQCETVPGDGRCVTGRDPQVGEAVNPNNYIHFYFKRPAGCP
jgi:hypothetical protein